MNKQNKTLTLDQNKSTVNKMETDPGKGQTSSIYKSNGAGKTKKN